MIGAAEMSDQIRSQIRDLRREAGFALAILALWMLALLGPLHQLSRTAGDLRLSGWSLCLPGGVQPDQDGTPSLVCPAHSIAKALTAPPAASGLRREPLSEFSPLPLGVSRPAPPLQRRGRRRQRAPPGSTGLRPNLL